MSRGRRQAGREAACWPTSSGGKTPSLFQHPHLSSLALPLLFLYQERPFRTPCRSGKAHSPHLIPTHSLDLCCSTPSSRKPAGMYPGWVRCLLSAPYGSVPLRHLNHTKSPSAAHGSVSTFSPQGAALVLQCLPRTVVLSTFLQCILKATGPSAFEQALSWSPVLPCADYHAAG